MRDKISDRVKATGLGRAAAIPLRLREVVREERQRLATAAAWMVSSNEITNYTYDLTTLNREHLAWFCAQLTNRPVELLRTFIAELDTDEALADHIATATANGPRRGVSDRTPKFGRRLGWYALARAMEPDLVVETGTDKGLGSVVFAAALLRNGHGTVLTVDNDPTSGWIIGGRWAKCIDRRVADSIDVLRSLDRVVDLFIHDSLHSEKHERDELRAVEPHLATHGLVLSDNAHVTTALSAWSEERDRQFLFFGEQPAGHWYPGAGIGAAMPKR